MLLATTRTRPARGARVPAPVRTRSTARIRASLVLITLALALTGWTTPGLACTGASGTRAIHSHPSLRAAPVLITGDLEKAAGVAAAQSEPTLVILCRFGDQDSTTSRGSWDAPIFGPYVPGGRSLRDYYHEVSYYQAGIRGLDLTPAAETCGPNNDGIVGWYQLSWFDPDSGQTYSTHPDHVYRAGWEQTAASQYIAAAAVAAADADVNFAAFDTNLPPDGVISANELHVIIVLAGYEGSYGNTPPPKTWRHHWFMNPGVTLDGVKLLDKNSGGGYSMVGELDSTGAMIQYGLICHEMGHDLGLPDLYDPTQRSEGIGEWGLMGSGDWCGTASPGDCPVHLDPWCKNRLGWLPYTVVPAGDLTAANIPQVETWPTSVYQLWSRGIPGLEYFLVENRQRTGYDRGLVRKEPADGLIIWHVNYAKHDNGNNEDENEKLLDVECADGLAGHIQNADDLDARVNRGDAKDPWYQGNDADFYTSSAPDNRDYRKPNNYNTSVEVRNISASGNPMTADLKVGKSAFIGSTTFTANGQSTQFNMLNAADPIRLYFLGYDCCGNTNVYEKNLQNAWVLVTSWCFNVPRHASFVSGQEVRQQAAQWTGQFKLSPFSLCGSGCDTPQKAGFDVDVYDNAAGGGGSSPGNGGLFAGWGVGFRDNSLAEFGLLTGSSATFFPALPGIALTQFPRRAGLSGVQSLHLMFDVLPNVYWEDVQLQLAVREVARPGPLTISCPAAQYPTRTVNVTAAGDYTVDLGWIHPTGGGPTELVIATGSAPTGVDLGWDWMCLATGVSPIDLVAPADGLVTRSPTPAFDWSDLYAGTNYELQVDDNADFSSPVLDLMMPVSAFTPPALGDGLYHWRARGFSVAWSDWAGPWHLRVDTQPPVFAGTTSWGDTSLAGPYEVRSRVTDAGSRVDSVSLYSRVDGGPWTRVTCSATGADGSLYEAELAGARVGDVVDYYLGAADFAGNTATDPPGAPGSHYTFHRTTTGVGPGPGRPGELVLAQSRPNPFTRTAEIRYGLPRDCVVSLAVYDMNGRRIRVLASGRHPAGWSTVTWDGRSEAGMLAPSGVYFYRLRAGEAVLKRKMLLMR